MSKETKNSKNFTIHEAKRMRQLIKRRLLGAFIVFALALILWQIGDDLPPQPIFRDVPAAPKNLLTAAENAGEQEVAAITETAGDTVTEILPPAVATAAATKTDEVRVSTVTHVVPSVIEKNDDAGGDENPAKAEQTQTAETEEKSDSPAKTKQSREAGQPKQNAPADNGGVLLRFQAAAFKDVKNVEALAEKLAGQNLATQVEAAGEWYRLYVIDLPDAAAVKVAKAAVKKLITASRTTEKESAKEEITEKFVLQVGAFGQDGRGGSIARQLRKEGFTVQLISVDKDGEQLARVRVFVSGSRADAEAARTRLIQLGYVQTKIIN